MNIDTVRNWLNLIFMLGAVVGLLYYLLHSKEVGTYIILCSMVVKFCESALRMMKI